ncbi:MAG: GAF domain-containing protein [Desulfovibrio sp.]|jgi:transcriptional regulator with GAF, ATPase, and Fis domain|nr:GAF domain-containing protein [Desulfovibrio sp.]
MQLSNYDRILAILGSVLNAYSISLFLPLSESQGKEKVYCLASGFSLGHSLDFSADVREGMGLVGWILRHGQALLVSNFDRRQNFLGYYRGNEEQHIKAFMGCALPGGGGALCADSKRQYSFSEQDQKMLHLFADLIARLLGKTQELEDGAQALRYYAAFRAVSDLRRRHSRWADFLRNFLDILAGATTFSYVLLCTRDSTGEGYGIEGENIPLAFKSGAKDPAFPMSAGLVGWVFRNNAQICGEGLEGGPEARQLLGKGTDLPPFQTVFALPLIIQSKTRGVLCLADENPLPLTEATRDFARMAAEHLSLFLENLFVKCRLRDLHRSG